MTARSEFSSLTSPGSLRSTRIEVLELLARGSNNHEIARRLGVAEVTVRWHELSSTMTCSSLIRLVIGSNIMQTKISTRWQTVVPREVRKELRIGPDWSLSWEVREGVAVVVPIPPDPVRACYGILRGRGGPSVEDLLEERRRDREREEAKEGEGSRDEARGQRKGEAAG